MVSSNCSRPLCALSAFASKGATPEERRRLKEDRRKDRLEKKSARAQATVFDRVIHVQSIAWLPGDVLVFLIPCVFDGALLLYFLRGFRAPVSSMSWAGAEIADLALSHSIGARDSRSRRTSGDGIGRWVIIYASSRRRSRHSAGHAATGGAVGRDLVGRSPGRAGQLSRHRPRAGVDAKRLGDDRAKPGRPQYPGCRRGRRIHRQPRFRRAAFGGALAQRLSRDDPGDLCDADLSRGDRRPSRSGRRCLRRAQRPCATPSAASVSGTATVSQTRTTG